VHAESLRSQLLRLRAHPSAAAFLYASDTNPPLDVEQEALDVINAVAWPNPTLSAASSRVSPLTGSTGVKMTGPYAWVPPLFYYSDKNLTYGGAWGFNTVCA
jgi:exo-1,4-beta-D-glucosaminidase